MTKFGENNPKPIGLRTKSAIYSTRAYFLYANRAKKASHDVYRESNSVHCTQTDSHIKLVGHSKKMLNTKSLK